jgi:N-acetylneuraminate epimerase
LFKQLTAERLQYWQQSPDAFRFNKDIIAYHTTTDTWGKIAELPYQAVAGAATVKSGDTFIIVNGEIKPGIRTNTVHAIEILSIN